MNDITTFLKRLKGITLSDNERLAMRERLIAYADLHRAALPMTGPLSPYVHFFTFIGSRRFSTYALALVLIVAGGGGISLASDSSVPGDSLYALKVNVNEPIMAALATTPASQAKVASDLATRRVDEAVTLANRGELTPDRQAYLSKQFTERVKVATEKTEELATLDSSAATSVKANLAANLAGEAQALGASEKKGHDDAFFRVVVATSESIANAPSAALATTGTSTAAAVAVATSTDTTSRTLVHVEHVRLSAAKTVSATSTVPVTGLSRFGAALRITATTTLRIASTSLAVPGGIIMPKLDVAIPSPSAETPASESGRGEK